MARQIPADRLDQLVARATQVFIAQGYRRTQMADVAEALGVAKGTIYLYVDSKEALFDLVVRSADVDGPLEQPRRLPIPTPKSGSTLKYVRDRLAQNQPLPGLAAALNRRGPQDARAELESIIRDLYRTLNRHRTAIRLLDRCAADYPELAAVWYEAGRFDLVDLLAQYLEARIRQKVLPPTGNPRIVARIIVETVTLWAVHRYWDPAPQAMDEQAAEETVVRFIVHGVTSREDSRSNRERVRRAAPGSRGAVSDGSAKNEEYR